MWKYKRATRKIISTSPTKVSTITMLIEDDSDPNFIIQETFTFTNDNMSENRFRAMVRRETKSYIDSLNISIPDDDVTDILRPM